MYQSTCKYQQPPTKLFFETRPTDPVKTSPPARPPPVSPSCPVKSLLQVVPIAYQSFSVHIHADRKRNHRLLRTSCNPRIPSPHHTKIVTQTLLGHNVNTHLEVPVDDLLLMTVVQRRGHVQHIPRALLLVEPAVTQRLVQLPPRSEL